MSKLWDNTVSHIGQPQKSAHGSDSKLSFNLNVQRQKATKTFSDRVVFSVKMFQGKATFRNLSRYSDMHEKRFSRWYRSSL